MNQHESIPIDSEHSLTPFRPDDKAFLVAYLNDHDVYKHTLRIPYPYTERDAEAWIAFCEHSDTRRVQRYNWVIRRRDGRLAGAVGLSGIDAIMPHRAELGYWLAKPYWGQGIMSAAVAAVVAFAKKELKLVKLTANIFKGNVASGRVLEKNGFKIEGRMRKHYFKDGEIHDSIAYGLILTDRRRASPRAKRLRGEP